MADLGSWAPDLPQFGHSGLVNARNVYPGALGYEPFRSLTEITAALPYSWRGGGAFDDLTGGSALVAGTDSGLYAYISGAWVAKKSGAYSGKWDFAQFGDNIIGVNGAKPVKYTMSSAAGADLGGSPPNASMIAIVRDFVFLAGDQSAFSTVTWSAVNNSEGWTVGTDQCDEQLIPDGGDITGLAGGEYGIVFQRSAISVFEYVGAPLVFSRRKVSDTLGAVCQGGIAQSGKLVFFLSNRGFYLFNEGELTAIGKDRVDRTFFASYSILQIQTDLRVAIHPNLNLVMWSMPGRLWIYNWGSDKWSYAAIADLAGITTGRTGYITLDALAADYPGGTDTVGLGTDDPLFSGGDPLLLIAKTDGKLYAFGGGTKLPATLRMAKIEPYPGNDTHVRSVRVVGDVGEGVSVKVDYAPRLADQLGSIETSDLRANGDLSVLARGRFLQLEVNTTDATPWSFINGLEIEGTQGGRL